MSKQWFAVDRRWGWYPDSWEGIVVLVAMVTSLCFTVYYISTASNSISNTLLTLFPFAALIVSFTIAIACFQGADPAFGHKGGHIKNYSPDNPKAYFFLSLLILPALLYYAYFQAWLAVLSLTIVFCLLLLVYFRLSKLAKT